MNAFQKRMNELRDKRKLREAARREDERFREVVRQNGFMRTFENAFNELNGTKITMHYAEGYYHYNDRKFREQELIIYAQMMQAELHRRDMQEGDE